MEQMKLSKPGLLALRGSDLNAKKRVARAARVHVDTIYRWIQNNDDKLTKAGVLNAISEETGLAHDLLLEDDKDNVTV